MLVDATIVVATYNHARHVSICFQGILQQTTSRRLQIIWHDDASTDDTIIVGERELVNCPHEIVRIHRKKNRMSRRVPTLLDIIEYCHGEYIFIVEGDDFWVHPNKVDMQIDALRSHPELNICFTPAFVASGTPLEVKGITGYHSETQTTMTLEQVIRGDGSFMPTASLCLRRQLFESMPAWLFGFMCVNDYPIQVLASSPAGAFYLPEVTCVYQINHEGSWTEEIFGKPEARMSFEVEFFEILLNMYNFLPEQRDAIKMVALHHFNTLYTLSINNNSLHNIEKALLILKEIK